MHQTEYTLLEIKSKPNRVEPKSINLVKNYNCWLFGKGISRPDNSFKKHFSQLEMSTF